MTLAGFNLAKSTAHAKVLNATSNVGGLLLFIIGGKVIWATGFVMMAGQFTGARAGSRLVLSKGQKLIRPMIVIVSAVMSAKLLYDSHGQEILTVGDALMNSTHKYEQLIEIFDGCFADDFNTRLIKGDDEPIYLPADDEVPYNRIVFAHGFYASGLHEISHWCIAGKARRELVDFGYWYCPDGRDAATQGQFEDVEVKPQALE